ncbi:MAG: hypothetical protein DRI61_00845 [Chloroflexi bacterium]|nr:MAG: hypothetical protein DRI61_00845 [Chloroflexota bacterium]
MIFGPVPFNEYPSNRKGFNLQIIDHLGEKKYIVTILNAYDNGDTHVYIYVHEKDLGLCIGGRVFLGEDLNG